MNNPKSILVRVKSQYDEPWETILETVVPEIDGKIKFEILPQQASLLYWQIQIYEPSDY